MLLKKFEEVEAQCLATATNFPAELIERLDNNQLRGLKDAIIEEANNGLKMAETIRIQATALTAFAVGPLTLNSSFARQAQADVAKVWEAE